MTILRNASGNQKQKLIMIIFVTEYDIRIFIYAFPALNSNLAKQCSVGGSLLVCLLVALGVVLGILSKYCHKQISVPPLFNLSGKLIWSQIYRAVSRKY